MEAQPYLLDVREQTSLVLAEAQTCWHDMRINLIGSSAQTSILMLLFAKFVWSIYIFLVISIYM